MAHESDLESQNVLAELLEIQRILDSHTTQIIIYSKCSRALDMIQTPNVDSTKVPSYILPKNMAGNEIDADYRINQKADLVTNMKNLLEKLKGFLPAETIVETTDKETTLPSEPEESVGIPKD